MLEVRLQRQAGGEDGVGRGGLAGRGEDVGWLLLLLLLGLVLRGVCRGSGRWGREDAGGQRGWELFVGVGQLGGGREGEEGGDC